MVHSARASQLLIAFLVVTCAMMAVAGVLRGVRASTSAAPVGTSAPVVVINIPGLSWSPDTVSADAVLASHLPAAADGTLFRFAGNDSFCASSAWSTISAGTVHGPDPGTTDGPESCGTRVRLGGAGLTGRLPDEAGAPGSLAAAAESHGRCVSAAGAFAALGAADFAGRLQHYSPDPTAFSTACRITLIDLGSDRGPVDAQLRAVLARIPAGTVVAVAGMSHAPGASATGLGALLIWGPGVHHGTLTSLQTRHPNLVALDDLSTYLFQVAGRTGFVGYGRPLLVDGAAGSSYAATQSVTTRAIATSASMTGTFLAVTITTLALVLLVLMVLLNLHPLLPHRRFIAVLVTLESSTLAALPAATFLVNAFGWQSAGRPRLALGIGVVVIAATIGAAASLTRSYRFGPLFTVAAVTWWTITADTILGSPWQLLSLMGLQPQFASRYFGMGNLGFGVYVTVTVLLLAVIGAVARDVWSPRTAIALVVLIGLASDVVDNAPGLGTDGGGGLALVPAVSLVIWGLTAKRHRMTWLVATIAVTCGAGLVWAGLDFLQAPAYRTHLGHYFDSFVHHADLSEFGLAVNIDGSLLHSHWWISLIPLLLIAFIAVVLAPGSLVPTRPSTAWRFNPTVVTALSAALVAWTIGFIVNDSGVSIPAAGMLTALPLLLGFGAWQANEDSAGPKRSESERDSRHDVAVTTNWSVSTPTDPVPEQYG